MTASATATATATAATDLTQGPSAQARIVYEFDVPEAYQTEELASCIGLVKLTGREEKNAAKRARGDSTSLAYELVKQSIWEVDGRRVNRAQHEDEKIFNAMDPILRNLMLSAYAELHTPDDDVTENFIKGKREKVG